MATKESPRSGRQQPAHPKSQPAADVRPLDDALVYLKAYARQKPETAALVCIGIGFVLGWKLKPW
jgi:hypothetical protein